MSRSTVPRAKPALTVVRQSSLRDPEAAPSADRVRKVVVESLEEVWGNPADMLHDVRAQEVSIQDEVPPAKPVDCFGVVVIFGQLPFTDYNEYGATPWRWNDTESPYLDVIQGLHQNLDDIEVWIDAVATQSGDSAHQ